MGRSLTITLTRMFKSKRSIAGFGVVLIVLLGWTASAQAHSTRSGDYTKVSEGEIVRTSLFVGGREIEIAGEIEGDLFCAGNTVTITGKVQGDVICAAQSIRISGTVDGDVRVASQDAVINGSVAGSLTAAVQKLELEGGGRVGRDVSAFASDVILSGQVGRDVEANARTLTVDGQVGRDVDAHTESFNLGGTSSVAGNVSHAFDTDLRRDPASTVAGRISRDPSRPAETRLLSPALMIVMALVIAIAMLATTLLLILLAPKAFEKVSAAGFDNLGKTVLIGAAVSLLVPITIIVLMSSVIGIPLGILLLLVWALLLFMSGPIAAFMAGKALLRRRPASPVKVMMAGSVAVLVLYFVPFLNIIAVTLVVWTGVGAAISSLIQLQRQRNELKSSSRKTDITTAHPKKDH